jgi:large subunit ribosomal protein L16
MKRIGKIWLNGFPDLSITKKPAETRMGKGKGNVEFWCLPVKTGRVLFEIGGISSTLAKEALLLAKSKLSLKTKIIFKFN